jgi:indolepyruvate ferredoxin oxidoreductase alpha subunit
MQERTHAFAMKSQIWLLDPRPNLQTVVDMVAHGYRLSEASSTPVMLELRVRACHVYGRFAAKDNRRPSPTVQRALANPVRDLERIVLPPANFLHEKEKIERRWPAAVEYVAKHRLNEWLGPAQGEVGIVVQGGMYNALLRAGARPAEAVRRLRSAALADEDGRAFAKTWAELQLPAAGERPA